MVPAAIKPSATAIGIPKRIAMQTVISSDVTIMNPPGAHKKAEGCALGLLYFD
jgi:hypothetical protein